MPRRESELGQCVGIANGAVDDEAYYSERFRSDSDQVADERARCVPGAVDYQYISRFGRIECSVEEEIVTERRPYGECTAGQLRACPDGVTGTVTVRRTSSSQTTHVSTETFPPTLPTRAQISVSLSTRGPIGHRFETDLRPA